MNKCEFSTPCIVLIGIGVLFLLWLIGKILGASFFFIAAVVIVFLILLIAYLVIRLHDEPLLEKIKNRLRLAEPEEQEEN